jgi:hypothetical protein
MKGAARAWAGVKAQRGNFAAKPRRTVLAPSPIASSDGEEKNHIQ